MVKYIYNNTEQDQVYAGVTIAAGTYYLVPANLEATFASDSSLISAITNATVIMSSTNDSGGQISNVSTAIDFLKGGLPREVAITDRNGNQLDTDGALIVRTKAAKKGWTFWSIPLEIVTSTIGASLYCKDNAGNSFSWVTAKIYDANNAEITTPGLLNANLATCVKTVVDFEPNFDFEIIGGALRISSNPGQDVRLWIVAAPDIPAQYGGSKEFASGINMKFLSANNSWDIDGRVSKFVAYDSVNHSGKIRMIIKHPAGLQVNLMFIAQIYRQ